MPDRSLGNWISGAGHPPDEELIAFLDGELRPRAAARIHDHVKSCWGCRGRLHGVEQVVADFVNIRREHLESETLAPPGNWRGFEYRLEQLAQQEPKKRTLRWPSLSWSVAAVTCIGAINLAIWLSRPVQIASAAEVLVRAEAAESQVVRRSLRPVVHQKLRIRRSQPRLAAEETTVDVWSDVTARRYGRAADDQLWREFREVLEVNRLDGLPPVSGMTFAAWRSSVTVREERVTQASGASRLMVTAMAAGPFRDQQIVEGELTLRDGDWRALSQRWRVASRGEIREYTADQVAYEVVPKNTLDPGLFGPPPEITRAVPRVEATPAEQFAASAGPSLDELEVDAYYTLHRRGDCLTGALQVVRTQENISIIGFVEDAAGKAQLLAALPQSPRLTLQIQTPEEMTSSLPAESPPPAAAASPPEGEIAAAPMLRELQFDGVRMVQLANDAIAAAGQVRREAWALRRLAGHYGSARMHGIEPAFRQKLEQMFAEHLVHLRVAVSGSRSLVAPVLGTSQARDGQPDFQSDGELLSLAAAAEHTAALIQDLFTVSAIPQSQLDAKVRDLRSSLGRLDSDFQQIEKHLSFSLSSGGKP